MLFKKSVFLALCISLYAVVYFIIFFVKNHHGSDGSGFDIIDALLSIFLLVFVDFSIDYFDNIINAI